MTSIRSHVVLDVDADTVWKLLSDAPNVANWFPAIEKSSGDETQRVVVLDGGASIEEVVVTSNPALRRFQYSAVGGDLPIERHLGTIDVIELAPNRSIVVYGTDIEPASLAEAFDGAISAAVAALPQQFG